MHIAEGGHALNLLGAWAVAVADAIHRSTEAVTGQSGAGPAGLVAVAADPGMSIEQLRRALRLTHPGAVRLVDRLADLGWVERRAGRGRTVQLMITARGRRVHDQLLAARADAVSELTRGVEPAVVRQLAELVAPALAAATTDSDSLRRLCRLCQRSACEPCPVAHGAEQQQPDHRTP